MGKIKADWQAVERDWKTGQYNNYSLAEKYGVSEAAIRKRSKGNEKKGLKPWKRDLTEDYIKGVKNELIENSSQNSALCELKNDEELQKDSAALDNAVAVGVAVVREHRASLKRLRNLCDTMFDKIERAIEEDSTSPIDKWSKGAESATDIILKLSKIQSEIIKNERTAFNLDEKEKEKENPFINFDFSNPKTIPTIKFVGGDDDSE